MQSNKGREFYGWDKRKALNKNFSYQTDKDRDIHLRICLGVSDQNDVLPNLYFDPSISELMYSLRQFSRTIWRTIWAKPSEMEVAS